MGNQENSRRCTEGDQVQRPLPPPAVILTNSVALDEGPVSYLTERLWTGVAAYPAPTPYLDWTVP